MTSLIIKIEEFLLWCSGACPEVLKDMASERTKYVCLGGAICTTWIFATTAGYFAFELIFPHNKLVQFIAAVIWGLIIFNLDRFIAITLAKTVNPDIFGADHFINFLRSLFQSFPRICIAIIIGIVISKPLELRLFKIEITSNLEKNLRKEMSEEIELLNEKHYSLVSRYDNKKVELLKEINSHRNDIRELREIYFGEIDGTKGTRIRGMGKIAEEKNDAYMEEKDARSKEINILTNQIVELDNLIEQERDDFKSRSDNLKVLISQNYNDGLLARLISLSELSRSNVTAWWTNLLLISLIILIETLPIIIRLFSPPGPYDVYVYQNNSKWLNK